MGNLLNNFLELEEEKKEEVIEEPKTPKTPKLRLETRPRSNDKRKLKAELRKLIHCISSGHRLYQQLGYENIIEAKARIQEIVDIL